MDKKPIVRCQYCNNKIDREFKKNVNFTCYTCRMQRSRVMARDRAKLKRLNETKLKQ